MRAGAHDRRVLLDWATPRTPDLRGRAAAHLDTLDDVYVEPVSVGIFFKRSRTFAELRPKQRWVALSFVLHRQLDGERLSRKVISQGSRYFHVVNLHEPSDVDDVVCDWLTEAYLSDE